MKRRSDGVSNGAKQPRIDAPYGYKILVPHALAASMLGKSGSKLKETQAMTHTTIKISERTKFYPGSPSRFGTVSGHSFESLVQVAEIVIKHINTVVSTPHTGTDLSELSSPMSPGALRLIFIVPKIVRGGVIGAGGSHVAELRSNTGCRVNVEHGGPGDAVVNLEGTPEGLCLAAKDVIGKIMEDSGHPWFIDWLRNDLASPPHHRQQPLQPQPPQRQHVQLQHAPEKSHPQHSHDQHGHAQQHMRSHAVTLAKHQSKVSRNGALPRVYHTLPEEVLNDTRGFSIQISVPLELKGMIIGKGGSGVKEILHESRANNVTIKDNEGSDMCTAHLEGSIMACSAAYLLFMRRYLQAEQFSLLDRARAHQQHDDERES